MVKLIGVLFILTSFLSLAAGAFIDLQYGTDLQATGSVISNILTQTRVTLDFIDYLEAIAFSYSIISFVMGIIFLVRV